MGAALKLLIGGPALVYVGGFGVALRRCWRSSSATRAMSPILKWLTLSLFAYVGVAVRREGAVGERGSTILSCPTFSLKPGYLTVVVAILGTTISPYLFFWQAAEEVEEVKERRRRQAAGARARAGHGASSRRIRIDTYLGMAFSNVVALFIVLTTAATLHAHGITDIQTSAQAAEALRPIAGDFAFAGLRPGHHRHRPAGGAGTGRLGRLRARRGCSAGMSGWRASRAGARRSTARSPSAGLIGVGLNLVHLDPIKALFWSAVINGVVAVPIMVMMMLLASRKAAMGRFVDRTGVSARRSDRTREQGVVHDLWVWRGRAFMNEAEDVVERLARQFDRVATLREAAANDPALDAARRRLRALSRPRAAAPGSSCRPGGEPAPGPRRRIPS